MAHALESEGVHPSNHFRLAGIGLFCFLRRARCGKTLREAGGTR